jgi:hypothetical protein
LDQWHLRSGIAGSERLQRVTFGQGRFVAVGQAGEIQTSSDGINWTARGSGLAASLWGILTTTNLFVVVGDSGTILSSTDGLNWVQRESGTIALLSTVAYGNGRFVAAGATNMGQNVVATSVDGTNWTSRLIAMGGLPMDLEFGNGRFVAPLTLSYGGQELATSIDGVSWDSHAWPQDNFPNRLTYANGQFVAVGGFCGLGGCSGSIVTSADGVNWTAAAFQPRFLNEVTFGRNQFVAVGGDCNLGGCDSLILSSTDGLNWVQHGANTRTTLTSIAFGNDTFVVLGQKGLILQSDPLTDTAPVIARQPLGQRISAGKSVTLSVVAYGSSPLTYQWSKGYEPLADATNATLVLNNVLLADSGNYVVGVINAFGSTNSIPAYLEVDPLGPLGNWHWRNPTPQSGALSSVVVTTNGFLAGGYGGFVLTSPNAVSWDSVRNDSIPALQNLAFGNGIFVGVTSTGGIAVSSDGLNWTNQSLGDGATLSSVAFGRGLFVGLTGLNWPGDGRNKAIATSADGVVWTPRDAGTTNPLYGVTYGNGSFLAVGASGTVAASQDGFTWKEYGTDTNSTLQAVTFGDNLFVAAGTLSRGVEGFTGLITTSRDGVDWTAGYLPFGPLQAVAWGNGVFVAAGGGCGKYGCSPELLSSTDGINWTDRSWAQVQGRFGEAYSALTFGQGTFIAIRQNGTIVTSVDGVRWQTRNGGVQWQHRMPGEEITLSAVTQGAGTLVAVGGYFFPYRDASLILSSVDGVNWTERARSEGTYFVSIAFGSGMFVAAAADGTVFTSPNGLDWASNFVAKGVGLSQVRYGASRFVLAGSSFDTQYVLHSFIWASEDGKAWVERSETTNVWDFRFAYGNGLFVAVSGTYYQTPQQTRLLTSSDGLLWTRQEVTGMGLSDVVFGNGLFVAMGWDCDSNGCWRVILTSKNGFNWTAHPPRYDPILTRLTFGQGYFVGLGEYSSLYFSTDGVHWINGGVANSTRLSDVGFGLDTFLAVGDKGAILQSDPVVATKPSVVTAPLQQSVFLGNAASLEVTATGSSPLTYQWFKDTTIIAGATNATLAFRQVNINDDGNYSVDVSNSWGGVVTQPVRFSVQIPPQAPELRLEFDPYVELTLVGRPGRMYQLQSLDNLQNTNAWQDMAVLQLPVAPFTWTDTQPPSPNGRFYRAKLLP